MSVARNRNSVNSDWWSIAFTDHYESDYYDIDGFVSDPERLTIAADDLVLMGDVAKKKVLHMQCNFGMETISLARLGAEVTGADICPEAIAGAKRLADLCKLNANFQIWDANSDSLSDCLTDRNFDMVIANYGVLEWIKDIGNYFLQAASVLREGGRLCLTEVHPVAKWMLRTGSDPMARYMDDAPCIENGVSYVNGKGYGEIIAYHHPMSRILSAILEAGFKIEKFEERESSSYRFHRSMVPAGDRWTWPKLPFGAPLLFAVVASK